MSSCQIEKHVIRRQGLDSSRGGGGGGWGGGGGGGERKCHKKQKVKQNRK